MMVHKHKRKCLSNSTQVISDPPVSLSLHSSTTSISLPTFNTHRRNIKTKRHTTSHVSTVDETTKLIHKVLPLPEIKEGLETKKKPIQIKNKRVRVTKKGLDTTTTTTTTTPTTQFNKENKKIRMRKDNGDVQEKGDAPADTNIESQNKKEEEKEEEEDEEEEEKEEEDEEEEEEEKQEEDEEEEEEEEKQEEEEEEEEEKQQQQNTQKEEHNSVTNQLITETKTTKKKRRKSRRILASLPRRLTNIRAPEPPRLYLDATKVEIKQIATKGVEEYGLVARVPLPINARLVYEGKEISESTHKLWMDTYEQDKTKKRVAYIIHSGRTGIYVDANPKYPHSSGWLGGRVNEPSQNEIANMWLMHELRPICRPVMVTTREIAIGEELLVHYGRKYYRPYKVGKRAPRPRWLA